MDAGRFDFLARSLGHASRRHALRLVVAGVGTAALTRFRYSSTAAKPRLCNGKKCTGHERCCPVFDCSGAVCVQTPGCVNLRSDPFHCGGCNRECDEDCCKGECCFPSGGQVCLPHGCGCEDQRLTPCAAGCVDLRSDPFHCGGCSTVCPEGTRCQDGRCDS